MLYLIQVTVYTALLYAIYIAVIKDRAAHGLSRAYLLLCAALPMVIPFIHIPVLNSVLPAPSGFSKILLPEITISSLSDLKAESVWNMEYIFITIYAFVVSALITRTAVQYLSLIRFVSKHDYKIVDGIKVLTDTHIGPGSFSDYIFLPGSTIEPVIYEHELAHIRLRHSADILFMRLLQACFWPNIILYAITKELKVIHEYQADACSVKNKEHYISVLLNDTFTTGCFSLAHTFFHHPLKRRIIMLQKTSPSSTKLRMTMLKTGFLAASVLSAIIYLQSCKPEPVKHSSTPQMVVYDTINAGSITGHREILSKAEIMPKPGYDLMKYLSTNLKYPELARAHKKEGRVIVGFIVDETGKIDSVRLVNIISEGKNIGPELLVTKEPELSLAALQELGNEAKRAVAAMPAWTPGLQNGKNVAVLCYQPINFQLD